MSIRDYKITDEQFNEKGMTSLPDTLKGTPYENKKSLEKFTREVVAPQFNAIVDNFADMEESANSWSAEEAQRVQQENARQSAEQGRVSAEETRVQSEKTRLSAESRRVADENARSAAETARANAENKRDTAEKSRVSAETGRVNAESARVTAESQRANAESVRAQNEAARISAETGRADAEADRVSAEDTRIANENARKSAETDRASAETVRESGENARKSAEKARASAEQQRESTESTRQTAEQSRAGAETARANAEKARADAETARVSAEQARATAESKRAAAETSRQNAETGRTDAETKRVSAETARVTAESKRADAETARATAETKRVSAETARASAESTRQTSEAARVSAEQSRAAAETARQTAEKARNVWEEYSAGKAYVPGNKVSFNGSSYVCTAATTGHAPTDAAYWLLIAKKGEDGKGAGDMLASVYDPKGKAQDVFQYADAKASAAKSAADTAQTGLNTHIASKSNPHGVTAPQVGADPKGAADTALTNAKKYTDDKIAAIPTPDVSGQIDTHNTDADAHADKFAKYLPLAGGEMTGDIKGIKTPTEDTMPTPKSYVDNVIGNLTPSACKVTLTASGWDSTAKTQSATVSGVLEDESKQLIMPMPAGTSMSAYNEAGIQMTAQAANTVTFTADTVPTTSIDVWVVVQSVNDVTPPPPLDQASWDYISQQSLAGNAKNIWAVGDCKAVKLSGTASELSLDTTLYVYILDFDHDKSSASGAADGITFGTFKTAASNGIDVCLVSGDRDFTMNTSNNDGGWKSSAMRYIILGSTNMSNSDATATTATRPEANTLMSCLPSDLRAVMRPMYIYTDNVGGGSDTASYVTGTLDYLPLLAEYEVHGARKYANSAEQNSQTQYAYYKNGNSKKKFNHSNISSAMSWWVRSPDYDDESSFCCVYDSGIASSELVIASYGVAPAFKI